MNLQEIEKFADSYSVESLDIKFTNLFGGLHHITMPVSYLNEALFEKGIGIDSSSVPGFKSHGRSDAVIIPDPDTAFIDPYWEKPTLSFLASVYRAADKSVYPLDPRQTAINAEKHLIKSGIADKSVWGPELEFHIFNSLSYRNTNNNASYKVMSNEAEWNECDLFEENVSSCSIPHQRGYHIAPPQDKHYMLRQKMMDTALSFGIDVKYHHHEVGRAGQSEIEIELGPLLKSADAVVMLKYICKMTAKAGDCCLTFMPKPLYNEAGNGMHFHQHLFKEGKPVFYDADGYEGLSKTALYYIGGILAHGSALLALTNPSTNSYKRLVPGFEAPVRAMFGAGNRSAAIRIPRYAIEPDQKRIEFRSPDAACNAYLAMAAQLMAGIDGIQNKIDPTELGMGPHDQDISLMSKETQETIPELPTNLKDAIDALEKDHDFLTKDAVFSENMIENWIDWKLNNEYQEIQKRPHPYEMRLYFDV